MGEITGSGAMDRWVCPNDRHLALRAKYVYTQLPLFGFTTRFVNVCIIFYCLYISCTCTLIGRLNTKRVLQDSPQ